MRYQKEFEKKKGVYIFLEQKRKVEKEKKKGQRKEEKRGKH